MTLKVVFVTTHPIQYQVPVFRHLAALPGIHFSVLFAMLPDSELQGSGFGVEFEWDIPLLEGYEFVVLDNRSKNPGVTHFSGCDTPGVAQQLEALKPDAVIVNGWVVKTCLQTLWVCRRLKIPCLVRGEANNLRPRPAWKRMLQRILVSRYSACLYIGEENRSFYRSLGVSSEKLFPSRYCVENDRFTKSAFRLAEQKTEYRAKWMIPADATCYLFCGKFELKKHPMELLQALREAIASGNCLHLLMVGDGILRTQCEQYSSEHNLPVTFAGFLNQSEIVEAYLAADCLVLPSDAGETWGLVVNEAMACGRPAIVSDLVGCAADLLVPGQTGEIFSFGDWMQLSEIMVNLSHNREKLRFMGANARGRVRSFSPEEAANGIADAAVHVLRIRDSAKH